MAAVVLETDRLSRHFGGLKAVDDVTLRIEEGEIRGLIGPNGAGKTTLSNVITGVYPPTSGDIRLRGESLVGLRPNQIALKGLLRTFQVVRLFGNMSVLDNLLLPFFAQAQHRRGMRRADGYRRAEEWLEITGLYRLRNVPAKHLSGGQQALLQMARAFMVEGAQFYVLDEPFAGVNPVVIDTLIEMITRKNRQEGVSFLLVSHEMAVVRRLCRRVSVMAEGRLIAEGTMEEVAADEHVIQAYLGR